MISGVPVNGAGTETSTNAYRFTMGWNSVTSTTTLTKGFVDGSTSIVNENADQFTWSHPSMVLPVLILDGSALVANVDSTFENVEIGKFKTNTACEVLLSSVKEVILILISLNTHLVT